MTKSRVPWFWWARLAFTVAVVLLFAAAWHHKLDAVAVAAYFGVGAGSAVFADLARWSYRQALKDQEKRTR